MKVNQKVWIRHIHPPTCVWDERINDYRDYLPDEERIFVFEGYVESIKGSKFNVRSTAGGHMNKGCRLGKYYLQTLEQDNGSFSPDYALHLTVEDALAHVHSKTILKTKTEFDQFMWKEYPKENSVKQYLCRVAMLKAYDFLSGKIDRQEAERKEISKSIYNKIMNEHDIK